MCQRTSGGRPGPMLEITLSSGYSKVLSLTKLREKGRVLLCRQNANANLKGSTNTAGESGQRGTGWAALSDSGERVL